MRVSGFGSRVSNQPLEEGLDDSALVRRDRLQERVQNLEGHVTKSAPHKALNSIA